MAIKTIELKKQGSPDVMVWVDKELDAPTKDNVRIKHNYIGLNFIDTYHRSGLYPLELPSGIGMEGSGIITKVGPEVTYLKVGDKVAYGLGPPGSYSDERNISEKKLVKIPEGVSERDAASLMLKGMTVEYLLERTFKVLPGHTVLFHAIAGGVGLIACQWLKSLGANVIGTAGSEEKAILAKENGCDHVILYKKENFKDAVMDITNGSGVNVVYDGVGKTTALESLDCLSPLGMLVLFGNSSGNSPSIDPAMLAAKGSLFLTRPTLMTYCSKREDMIKSSNRVFEMLSKAKIKTSIGGEYSLEEIVNVHRLLEDRKTKGAIVLKNNY